jgi:hypothetical protein
LASEVGIDSEACKIWYLPFSQSRCSTPIPGMMTKQSAVTHPIMHFAHWVRLVFLFLWPSVQQQLCSVQPVFSPAGVPQHSSGCCCAAPIKASDRLTGMDRSDACPAASPPPHMRQLEPGWLQTSRGRSGRPGHVVRGWTATLPHCHRGADTKRGRHVARHPVGANVLGCICGTSQQSDCLATGTPRYINAYSTGQGGVRITRQPVTPCHASTAPGATPSQKVAHVSIATQHSPPILWLSAHSLMLTSPLLLLLPQESAARPLPLPPSWVTEP